MHALWIVPLSLCAAAAWLLYRSWRLGRQVAVISRYLSIFDRDMTDALIGHRELIARVNARVDDLECRSPGRTQRRTDA